MMHRMRRTTTATALTRVAVVLVLFAAVGAGCSTNQDSTTLLVSVAASLESALQEIASEFEDRVPDVVVDINSGGSNILAAQIIEGAPVDVFASANIAAMEDVLYWHAATRPVQTFALNTVAIAVPPGNPGSVSGLEDFGNEDLFIGLCLPAVPCGSYARESLASAGVVASVDTEEPNVRSLMLKIESGEIDAGIVYESDVIAAAGSVESIPIPNEHNVDVRYPIAVVSVDESGLAAAFVAFVVSDDGREILASYGFELP